jgi:hypothetical protein
LFHLLDIALLGSFVGPPTQKFCAVTKPAAGEMVVLNFHDQLASQRFPFGGTFGENRPTWASTDTDFPWEPLPRQGLPLAGRLGEPAVSSLASTSPKGAPKVRNRAASSNSALSFINMAARFPDVEAGDNTKTRSISTNQQLPEFCQWVSVQHIRRLEPCPADLAWHCSRARQAPVKAASAS